VHRTDPAAGTVVTDGTIIKLFYNPSPELKAVPDVTGRSLADAQAALAGQGFQFELGTPENHAEIPEGSSSAPSRRRASRSARTRSSGSSCPAARSRSPSPAS
jgi:beta-lactam-binding protein with PASTA domain